MATALQFLPHHRRLLAHYLQEPPQRQRWGGQGHHLCNGHQSSPRGTQLPPRRQRVWSHCFHPPLPPCPPAPRPLAPLVAAARPQPPNQVPQKGGPPNGNKAIKGGRMAGYTAIFSSTFERTGKSTNFDVSVTDFLITAIQICICLTIKGHKNGAVYNLGAHNFPKHTPAL
jgi:hypothetical protein